MFKELPLSAVNYSAAPSFSRKYHTKKFLSDQMQELGISADITITMLTMPLEITGSASYKNMQMNYKDTKSYSESIVYATGTSHLSQSMCTPNVELADKLVDAGATHVVVGITYGARCNVKYE